MVAFTEDSKYMEDKRPKDAELTFAIPTVHGRTFHLITSSVVRHCQSIFLFAVRWKFVHNILQGEKQSWMSTLQQAHTEYVNNKAAARKAFLATKANESTKTGI